MFYHDDSPSSDDTSDTLASSDIMEVERVCRILKLTTEKVNAFGLDDDLLSCEDWEDLLALNRMTVKFPCCPSLSLFPLQFDTHTLVAATVLTNTVIAIVYTIIISF